MAAPVFAHRPGPDAEAFQRYSLNSRSQAPQTEPGGLGTRRPSLGHSAAEDICPPAGFTR